MEAVLATGYSGPLSLEIFNDQFRSGSAVRTATDGLRSLILLQDQLAEKSPDASVGPGCSRKRAAAASVSSNLPSSEAEGRDLIALFGQLGFRKTGAHRSKDVERWSQGNIELVDQL